MANHSLNQGFVKFFIEDREDYKKMALTLLHSELKRILRAFSVLNIDKMHFF